MLAPTEHPTYWAIVQAPTEDAVDRLILIGISDNPAGERMHSIRIERLAKHVRITVDELGERIKKLARTGLIMIRPEDQYQHGPDDELTVMCMLNLSMVEEGY